MDFDERAGRLIQELRQEEGMTQAELAQAMSERGFPMHQQTILKIEKGSRALRLAEALAISRILKTDINLFEAEPLDETISRWADALETAELNAISALEEWLRENRVARESIHMMENAGIELDPDELGHRVGAARDEQEVIKRLAHMVGIAEERLRRPEDPGSDAWLARVKAREAELHQILSESSGKSDGERQEKA